MIFLLIDGLRLDKFSGKISNTTYLISGEKAGTKLKKAIELGIKILNEYEFNQLLSI